MREGVRTHVLAYVPTCTDMLAHTCVCTSVRTRAHTRPPSPIPLQTWLSRLLGNLGLSVNLEGHLLGEGPGPLSDLRPRDGQFQHC